MTDIVERLRTSASQAGYPKHYIYDEAAAEIERLRADRHMWRERADMWRDESVRKQAACEQIGARIVALEAEAERLREALQQTAALFEQIVEAIGADPEETRLNVRRQPSGQAIASISVADCFRNARAALAAKEPGHE